MLAILQKIELPHRNHLRIPSTDAKQPSYKIPLNAYFENIAWNVWRGGFTIQSYIQDSTFYNFVYAFWFQKKLKLVKAILYNS